MRLSKREVIAGFVLCIFAVCSAAAFSFAEETAFDKAAGAYAKKDFNTAAKYFREYVENKPDPRAYYLLGYSLYKLKRHSEAVKYFREAFVLDPDLTPVPAK